MGRNGRIIKSRQRFRVYVNVNTENEKAYDVENDLFDDMHVSEVEDKFEEYIENFTLNPNGRYVAVGDAGDSIIYDAGTFYYTSDSN